MEKIIQIIKNHKWAIILAAITLLIVVAPQIYFRYDNKEIYKGIEQMADSPWTPRVEEAREGHFNFGAIYYKDGKSDPYLFQPLGSIVVAFLGKLFSLDLNSNLLLFRIIFPFIVFLLIYGFVFTLSKSKPAALTSAAVILLAESIISRSGIFSMLNGEAPRMFIYITRVVNPLMTFFFFFGFLLCFSLFWTRGKWWWGLASTLMLGLTFYDYFYTWTFLYAFFGVSGLILLFKRNWKELKKIIIISIGGAILAIPYFLNIYRATQHPNYKEVGEIFGLLKDRALTFGFTVPVIFILFLIFFPRKWKEQYSFGLALVLAPFIVLNQQIITGRLLQVGHYHWFFHTPLAIVILLIMLFYWLSEKKLFFIKKAVLVSTLIMSIYTGIFIQATSYIKSENGEIEIQKYGPVMDWLKANSEKEEVVFGNDMTSHLVVIYTSLNVFHHRAAMYSLSASRERLFNSVFTYYRLDGVGKNDAQKFFFDNQEKTSWEIYGMLYRETVGNNRVTPDEVTQGLIDKYKESLSVPNNRFLDWVWNKYKVGYLVWDKKVDPKWQLDQYSFFKKVAEFDDFAIYEKK